VVLEANLSGFAALTGLSERANPSALLVGDSRQAKDTKQTNINKYF
jgi:hypothetical protein